MQYVNDLHPPRPTPASFEQCYDDEMGRYDLTLAMAIAARRIQKTRLIAQKDSLTEIRYPTGPAIAAMTIYS